MFGQASSSAVESRFPEGRKGYRVAAAANPAFVLFQSATDEALECLTGKHLGDEDAHTARKALRKARAALRMLRPLLSRDDCAAYNHALRDAGRYLSPLRDARILLDTLDSLVDAKHDGAATWHADEIAEFRRTLEARLRDARDKVAQIEARRHCLDLIEQGRDWLEHEHLARASENVLSDALRRIYSKARNAFILAREAPSLETTHEWRKQTKYLRAAAAMLRTTQMPGLHRMEKRANDIAGWLGEDHDLALLLDTVRASEQLNAKLVRHLVHRVKNRRSKLQRKAFSAGEEFFAKTPSAPRASTGHGLHAP